MASEFELDQYLSRIGYQAALTPDRATLAALHAAHVDAIAFEGLDPFLRRAVQIELSSVVAKLVHGRRGGYCFEQNALFKAALAAIGFQVTGLSARVRWRSQPESPLTPRTHMVLKVDLADGSYLADVGFGSCLLDTPLKLVPDIEQPTAMGTYRLTEADGLFWLAVKLPKGWRTMYAFDLQPQIHADYVLGSWYSSTFPQAVFTQTLVMERLSLDRRYRLIDRRFVVEARGGEIIAERQTTTADELAGVIDEIFGVTLPVAAEEVWRRFETA